MSQEAFPWPVRILGAAFLAAGLAMVLRVLVSGRGGGDAGWLIFFLAGVAFILLGLFLFEAQALLGSRAPALNWNAFWGGLLTAHIGFVLMVVSFADPRDEAFHAPRWVVALIGLLFALCGILVLRTASPKYREGGPLTDFGAILVVLVLTCAGIVFSYAAFGPGSREFDGTFAFPCFAVPFEPNEYVGRAVFGIVALVIDAFAIAGWYGLVRGTWQAIRRRLGGKTDSPA